MSTFLENFGTRLPTDAVVAFRVAKYPTLQQQTIRLANKVSRRSIEASLTGAVSQAFERQAQRAKSGEAAGLVPYKTNLDASISFAKPVVAERRVNRLKKSVWASGHLHGFAEKGHRPPQCWFVTLTYARANSWVGNHISKAIQGFRNWCQSKGVPCRYTWVSEIQPKRLERTGEAVVHYHLLAWLPVGVSMPQWDRSTRKSDGERAAFWSHGMTNTEKVFSGVGYLMKYLSKLGELTIFPKGLRLYGIGGLTDQARAVRTWYNLPEWVKRTCGVGDVKKQGSAFVMRATGEILEPAYSCIKTGFCLILRALRPLPERFHDGAYSTVSFI